MANKRWMLQPVRNCCKGSKPKQGEPAFLLFMELTNEQ